MCIPGFRFDRAATTAVMAIWGLAAACSGAQKPSAGSAANNGQNSNLDHTRCDERGKRVVTSDTNGDNKPDIWKLYSVGQQNGQEVQVLACKQVDLNHDGRVDMVDHFDDSGALVATEFDLDFDGKFDRTVFFQQGRRVRAEQDLDFDGKPDEFEYYENDKLVRMEIDSNGDGKIDTWQYYENGKLDRIGYDTTGTGRVDKWERAAEDTTASGEAAPAPAAPAAVPASQPPPNK